MMKIVHICLSGLYMDGWGYQDNMIAKYHVIEGHDVTVIANKYTYDHEGNYVKIGAVSDNETDCNGVKIVRLDVKNDTPLTGPAMRIHYIGLFDALCDISPEVIFLHNPQIMDTEDIADYMKKYGDNDKVRLFVDSHSDYSNSGRNFLSKHILHGMLWRYKVKKLVPYTKKFYGVLPARVDFILDRYKTPKDKTELLVMGMDDELAEKARNSQVIKEVRRKLGIQDNDFLVITGGKIDSAKRQTLLLIDAIKNIGNNVKLVIFGSIADDMKEEVKSKADIYEQSIEDVTNKHDADSIAKAHIIYIGWLKADDTYPYFAAADLAVFPGRHSVMWEQVAGQGIPMLIKYWEGTTHVDLGGNVKFLYDDSTSEMERMINSLKQRGKEYEYMLKSAKEKGSKVFSYREIAKKCIE